MAKRLFFALELPSSIRGTLAEINPAIPGVAWTRVDKMHLTLSFLGNVGSPHEDALRQAVDSVRVPPFFLPVRGVGTFGGAYPTVVWAGVGNGHPHLFALYKHLQDVVLRARLEPDLRPFHPHITLARPNRVAASALRPFVHKHAESDFGVFTVKEFVLFSSQPDRTGSIYTSELRKDLIKTDRSKGTNAV
jgi:2'-5' RNA ligase